MIILWVLLPIAMMVQTCVAAPIRPDEVVAAFDNTIANYMQSAVDILVESEIAARKLYNSLPETEENYKLRLDLEKYMNEVTKNKLDADNVSIDVILSMSSLIDLIDKHQTEETTENSIWDYTTDATSNNPILWDHTAEETDMYPHYGDEVEATNQSDSEEKSSEEETDIYPFYGDLTTEEEPTTHAVNEEESNENLDYGEQTTEYSFWSHIYDITDKYPFYGDLTTEEEPIVNARDEVESTNQSDSEEKSSEEETDIYPFYGDLTTEEEPTTHAVNEEESNENLDYGEQTTEYSFWSHIYDITDKYPFYGDLTTEEEPIVNAIGEEESTDQLEEQALEKPSFEEENTKETSPEETTEADTTKNAVTKPPVTQHLQALQKMVLNMDTEKLKVESLKEALRYTLENAKRDQGNYFLNLMVDWDHTKDAEAFTKEIKVQYEFVEEKCDGDMVCIQEIVEKGRIRKLLRQMVAQDTSDEAAKLKSDIEALLKTA